jgi:hypothetical protein
MLRCSARPIDRFIDQEIITGDQRILRRNDRPG